MTEKNPQSPKQPMPTEDRWTKEDMDRAQPYPLPETPPPTVPALPPPKPKKKLPPKK